MKPIELKLSASRAVAPLPAHERVAALVAASRIGDRAVELVRLDGFNEHWDHDGPVDLELIERCVDPQPSQQLVSLSSAEGTGTHVHWRRYNMPNSSAFYPVYEGLMGHPDPSLGGERLVAWLASLVRGFEPEILSLSDRWHAALVNGNLTMEGIDYDSLGERLGTLVEALEPWPAPDRNWAGRWPEGLGWWNYWSHAVVARIGESLVRTAPLAEVVPLPTGLLLQATPDPPRRDDFESLEHLVRISDHLRLRRPEPPRHLGPPEWPPTRPEWRGGDVC